MSFGRGTRVARHGAYSGMAARHLSDDEAGPADEEPVIAIVDSDEESPPHHPAGPVLPDGLHGLTVEKLTSVKTQLEGTPAFVDNSAREWEIFWQPPPPAEYPQKKFVQKVGLPAFRPVDRNLCFVMEESIRDERFHWKVGISGRVFTIAVIQNSNYELSPFPPTGTTWTPQPPQYSIIKYTDNFVKKVRTALSSDSPQSDGTDVVVKTEESAGFDAEPAPAAATVMETEETVWALGAENIRDAKLQLLQLEGLWRRLKASKAQQEANDDRAAEIHALKSKLTSTQASLTAAEANVRAGSEREATLSRRLEEEISARKEVSKNLTAVTLTATSAKHEASRIPDLEKRIADLTASHEAALAEKDKAHAIKVKELTLATTELAKELDRAQQHLLSLTTRDRVDVETGERTEFQIPVVEAIQEHDRKRKAATAFESLVAETTNQVVQIKKEKLDLEEDLESQRAMAEDLAKRADAIEKEKEILAEEKEEKDELNLQVTLHSDKLMSHIDKLNLKITKMGGVPEEFSW